MEKTIMNNTVSETKGTGSQIFKYLLFALVVFIISFGITFLGLKNLTLSSPVNGNSTAELGPVFQSPEYTVNLANTNGRHFLKTQFSLEMENKKVLKEIEEKLPVFNDKVISTLSTQTIGDLNSPEGLEKIKEELKNNLNSFLVRGKVVNIYFNDFIWQ